MSKAPAETIENELLQSGQVNRYSGVNGYILRILKAIANEEIVHQEGVSGRAFARHFDSDDSDILSAAVNRLMKGPGGSDYKEDAVIQDKEGVKVLSENAVEVSRGAVSRFYARELIDLFQDMSNCSAETRQAIADEIVSSIGTDAFVARETEVSKERALEVVSGARKMLKNIAEALVCKSR